MNTKHTSALEVGLVAFLFLVAVAVAVVATGGTTGPAADSPGTAIVKANAGTGN